MGKCNICQGIGKVRGKGLFDNIISTCMECGGSGNDKKPYCTKHKKSMLYSGAVGWYCQLCDDEWSIGYAITH